MRLISCIWSIITLVSLSIFCFILIQVLSISLAALGSLMWLRKNKPKTLIPIIYACAGIVATMPSITRSGLNTLSVILRIFPDNSTSRGFGYNVLLCYKTHFEQIMSQLSFSFANCDEHIRLCTSYCQSDVYLTMNVEWLSLSILNSRIW